jgi:hypothetical protein
MNLGSILLWGFVATIVVTTIMQGGQSLGLSRMSLPFMVGTMFTANRDRAAMVGFLAHLLNGWIFAFLYALAFESWHRATWWLGAGIGLVHGLAVLVVLMPVLPGFHPRMASEQSGPEPTRMLEPPGFLALHYGRRTPLLVLLAHLAYGAIIGGFYQRAGLSRCSADDHLGRKIEEETGLHHAWARAERPYKEPGIRNAVGESGIDEIVALVRAIRGRPVAHPQHRLAAQRADRRQMGAPTEGSDLDRQWILGPEAGYQLGAINDDHQPAGAARDDPFPQERAARPLEQIAIGVHLVGAVDREIELGVILERRQGNAARQGLPLRRVRRGDAEDLAQDPAFEPPADLVDYDPRGRAAAETDDHPRLHEVHRAFSRVPLVQSPRIDHGVRQLAPSRAMSSSAFAGPHFPAG